MDFWANCSDDVLTIFKNFDLKIRLEAGQTCRRWYQLLKDPHTRMEDVSIIHLKKYKGQIPSLLNEVVENLMDGLAYHVGKAEQIDFEENNLNILSTVSRMINIDGGLKIDKFCASNPPSVMGFINGITLSTIRELNLSRENVTLMNINWSQLPNLERLSLTNISIDLSTSTSWPALKYFKTNSGSTEMLNANLKYLPTLEELYLSEYSFDDRSFRNFLLTIINKLSNLCRLHISKEINLSNIDALVKEFSSGFKIESLKEVRFKCGGDYDYIEIAKLFLRICTLDIISIDVFNDPRILAQKIYLIYNLTPWIAGPTKLELAINFGGQTEERPKSPIEYCHLLSKIQLGGSTLSNFFGCDSYENLTEIELWPDKDVLKVIAKKCPFLKKLHFSSCGDHPETYKDSFSKYLRPFLIYWHDRRSKELSMECIDLIFIDSLFGTSFEQGCGILDENWMMEDDENGSATKKKKFNEKRWMVFRKRFKINSQLCGKRLIIWDQGNRLDASDQKILVIKNYEKDKLMKSVNVKAT